MAEKYDLDRILAEIAEDENRPPADKQKQLSQDEIRKMMEKKRRERAPAPDKPSEARS